MSDLHIIFKVAEGEYVLPASEVMQMDAYTGAVKVPGTADYVAGLMQSRGRVVPVVDLRRRFGLASGAPTPDSRVVVVTHADRTVGLLVDYAREVIRIPAESFHAPPEVLARDSAGFVKSVAQAGSRLVMLIDFAKVIGEEQIHGS